jgi:subtilisin family serine protease
MAVTAVDSKGKVPKWSTAIHRPWVKVAAPGEAVVSTFPRREFTIGPDEAPRPEKFDGFATWGGTSFATAQVTGAIAALTVPGRVTAKEAADQLLRDAAEIPVEDPHLSRSESVYTKPWIK